MLITHIFESETDIYEKNYYCIYDDGLCVHCYLRAEFEAD